MSTSTVTPERWDSEIDLPEARSNRPVTFMHRVENRIAKTLLGALGKMEIEKASHRMATLMETVGPMLRPVHRRGHDNLALVYPDMTMAERSAILRGVWRNLGATVGEFAHLERIAERVTVKNEERLREWTDSNQKAIFFSAHMGNWETMAPTLLAYGLRYAIVYRPANNPLVDEDIIHRRASAMSRRQIPKGKRGARDLIKVLNEGLSLCMLTDQKLNDGIASPLLGFPAMTTPAPARLALREKIPLIPLQLVREPGSRFVLTVHEPLSIQETGDSKTDIQALTDAMNAKLGEFILERPDQWLWLHRRWPKKVTA